MSGAEGVGDLAGLLGNRPAVLRQSYLHPPVDGLRAEERALVRPLGRA